MPNGVSCAYFAVRNYEKGIKDHNLFRSGIAGAQTVRTADAVAQNAVAASSAETGILKSASPFLQKMAGIARKILYPLIICSGIYSTVKSDDKVKTGVSQAAGIGTMYAFEQVAEKALKSVDSKVKKLGNSKKEKAMKICWYIAKGLSYATASMTGYSVGMKGAGALIDSYRQKNDSDLNSEKALPEKHLDESIFADMKLD